MSVADTTNFSVNSKDGWKIYNSHLTTLQGDSILIELILQHKLDMNWDEEQEVGKIKTTRFCPKQEQVVQFKLIEDRYELRIAENGKCYLKVIDSLPDSADPAIIPVRAVFSSLKSK
jgi:hypothetical protein